MLPLNTLQSFPFKLEQLKGISTPPNKALIWTSSIFAIVWRKAWYILLHEHWTICIWNNIYHLTGHWLLQQSPYSLHCCQASSLVSVLREPKQRDWSHLREKKHLWKGLFVYEWRFKTKWHDLIIINNST